MDAKESKPVRKQWLRQVLLSKTFIIIAALIVTYTLAGFFLAPYLVKRQATRFARESLKCDLVVEDVRVNPYALTLEIRNFDLKDGDGSLLFSFETFFVNFQVSSLWRWAWTFAEVRLDGPDVNLEINREGRINFVELADRIPRKADDRDASLKGKGEGETSPPRVIFDHIALNQGRVAFTDRSGETPGSIVLDSFGMELKDLTTLLDRRCVYTFDLTLPHGAKLDGDGQVTLHPLWSEGRMEVKGFKTVSAWEFLQDELLVDRPGGEVDVEARFRFAEGAERPSFVIEGLKMLVSGLELKARGGQVPFFSMETIRLDDGRLDLASRSVLVGDLALSKGRAAASVNEQGRLSFQELVKASGGNEPSALRKGEAEEAPLRVALKSVRLDDFAVAYSDRSRAYPLEMGVSKINVKFKADLSLSPERTEVLAEDLNVLLAGISCKEAGQESPLATLESLSVEGGRLDLEGRKLTLSKIMVNGGHTAVVLEKPGVVNLSRVFGPGDEGKLRKEIAEAKDEAKAEGRPWSVSVGSFETAGLSLGFKNQALSPEPALNLDDIRVKLADIHSEGKTPVSFEASLTVREGGGLKAEGQFTPAEKSAKATFQLSNLALTPFQPYVAPYVYLSVDGGELSISGSATYQEDGEGPKAQFSGDAEIASLLVTEAEGKQLFLSWEALKTGGIRMSLEPDRLEIGEIRLVAPYGKLIIYEDQSLNLHKVLRPKAEAVKETEPVPQKEPPDGFPVDVRRIRVEKGHLDFADLSLRPQFATEIHDLNGAVVGLSTKEGERAQIQLEGRVDEYGMSRIRGELEPLNVKHFADINMAFKNVDMTNLTPYSGKFAGYRIDSGKLSLDLHYLIEQSALKGNNQIILDNLTLGEKVESPAAPNIPLELALALLRDADGRIDIGLPVSGNLDDPQFSYGHLIWKALVGFFTKIVTSPFRALGAMFGIEKENLGTIEFEPGRAELLPPEREKVKILSEALAKRPQLSIKIGGRFDPAADVKAMKIMAIRLEIAKRTGRGVVPGEDAGPVDIGDPLVQQAIEAMVIERISPDTLASAREEIAKRAAKGDAVKEKDAKEAATKGEKAEPAPLPPELSRELYTSLLKRLIEAHPVAKEQLNELSMARAEAIKQGFLAAGAIEEGRMTVLEPSAAKEEAKETVPSELTLDVRR